MLKTMDIAALDGLELCGNIRKLLKFKVRCSMRGGQPVFTAELKGGRVFRASPVLPKDENGNQITPASVENGAEGYLVLEISRNAMVAMDDKSVEITVRPGLIGFEPTVEEASKRL